MQITFVDSKTVYTASYPNLDLQDYSGGDDWELTNGAFGYFAQLTEVPTGAGSVFGSETGIFSFINGTTTIRATRVNGGESALLARFRLTRKV